MNPKDETEISDLYRFASLEKYSFKKRFLIRLIDLALYSIIRLIGMTVRFEAVVGWDDLDVEGAETFEKAIDSGRAGIIAFWHDRIFLTTYYWRKHDAAVMVSKSFDGEYITRTAQRFGYGVVRGSSSRGGSAALAKMMRIIREGSRMVFTVDGPRGPRYKAKMGAVLLSRETQVPIVPMSVECKSFWALNSWDKTQIPKPFTKAVVFVEKPVFVEADADNKKIKERTKELESKLDELVRRGEEWRQS